jgi:hypothetical protein
MRWLLLAALLVVPQAPPSTVRPTPDKTAPTQQGTEVSNNSSIPPDTPSQPASETNTTTPDKNPGASTRSDVSLTPVEISKFPPVSVAKGWTHGTRIASPWLPCFTCVTPTRSGRFASSIRCGPPNISSVTIDHDELCDLPLGRRVA